MEDEDGTCLLDVLCDPQALNDFLHGTKELLSGDLLINSSSGEPSLFTDTPSPVSLLADDVGSHDTPISGCVDLSFLDEALLGSPAGEEDADEVCEPPRVEAKVSQQQEEEEETCDILQQSLQEADITEHTLALEAGLAQSGEMLSLYPSGIPSPQYMSKQLSISGVTALQRDTQVAVEPPQPSLLAVGPGCPSLKPVPPQLMGLLPGNVFPAPPTSDTSFCLSRAQGSKMIIHKTLQGLTLSPAVRTAPPEIMLQRTPLPIQPKLPVNIQPRLVQISQKPLEQKLSPGLAFIPPATSQNIMLSSPVGPRQPLQSQSTTTLNKPVSLQLVNPGGSIVIQPQSLFQGPGQFILPSQSSVNQTSIVSRPLLSTTNNQMPNAASLEGQLVDGSQIVTVRPRQLNFSPVFTTPTGQLTLRQGALLSGPLQLQSTPPTVFQMPAQIAGAFSAHAQGQQGGIVHASALGKQITLINTPGMLAPDMTAMSIVNRPSLVQSLPFVTQAQRPMTGGPEDQLSLPQTQVLFLPERVTEDKNASNEQLQSILQQAMLSSPASVQSVGAKMQTQHSPVILQAPSESTNSPETVTLLSKHIITHPEKQQAVEGHHTPPNQAFKHQPLQETLNSLASGESLESNISPVASESSNMVLAVCASSEVLSVLSECGGLPTPVHSGSELGDVLASPPVTQRSASTPSAMFPTPPLSDRQPSAFMVQSAKMQGQEDAMLCMSPSSTPEKTRFCEQQHLPIPVSTGLDGVLDSVLDEAQQHMQQSIRVPGVLDDDDDDDEVSLHLQQSLEELSSQDSQGPTALQVPCASVKTRERLVPAMLQQRFKQQLCSDYNSVLNPNTHSRFTSLEDAVRRLLPYHTCSGTLPSQEDLLTVDKQFKNAAELLLKCTTDMLNKYRQLLLAESQQESPSAEMVMLERLFLQSERLLLGEEKHRARGDPESLQLSLRKAPWHRSMLPSRQTDASASPPSPPAWALHSDRPPGLKTYCSRNRGALRLTIKHESGSRKVIHNSACDEPHTLSRNKRTLDGQLNNRSRNDHHQQQQQEEQERLLSPTETEQSSQQIQAKADVDINRTASKSIKSEHKSETAEGSFPDVQPLELKRRRLDIADRLGEEDGLTEHLQSAIDSILELQRLQGPAAGLKPKLQPCTLEQSISCVLEGEM